MLLVGLDVAWQPEKFDYSVGSLAGGCVDVLAFGLLSTKDAQDALTDVVAPALRGAPRALIAVDAPLGWPARLARSLVQHRPGEAICVEKAELFSGENDGTVAGRVGKKPLEVGADKIARAAHTAVAVLARLRKLTERPIPLAWSPAFHGHAAIEVYPGATLKARGLTDSGYKKLDDADKAVRSGIAQGLHDEMPARSDLIDQRADIFDACLCLIAAKDFLEVETFQPTDALLARLEGWIWVRNPQ